MTDPRDLLTEETPESAQDLNKLQLTEVGGRTQVSSNSRILTVTLPTMEEDEEPTTLLG